MPIYNIECPKCGPVEALLAVDAPVVCNDCGSDAKRADHVSEIVPMGIIYSNSVQSKQLGRTFTSNSEYQKYLRDNELEGFDRDSAHGRRRAEEIRAESDKYVQRNGFKDTVHFRAERGRRRDIG